VLINTQSLLMAAENAHAKRLFFNSRFRVRLQMRPRADPRMKTSCIEGIDAYPPDCPARSAAEKQSLTDPTKWGVRSRLGEIFSEDMCRPLTIKTRARNPNRSFSHVLRVPDGNLASGREKLMQTILSKSQFMPNRREFLQIEIWGGWGDRTAKFHF